MRAALRFTMALFAAGLWLAPALALAQSAPPPATNTPATDTIGPRELQGFSLNGTVTKQADTPPARSTRPQVRQPSPPTASTATPAGVPRAAPARPQIAPRPTRAPPSAPNLPPAAATPATSQVSAPQPGFSPEADRSPVELAPEQTSSLWPWLALAAAIGAGAALLLWRRRSRKALASGAQFDLYREPEPQPQARPAPELEPSAPPPSAPKSAASPTGLVTTKLRPWVELAFAPLGCIVDDETISVEFEVQIRNSGNAPARDILVEASMFNASATQDQDLSAFFSKAAGPGDRIEALPPLQSVTIRSALVAPRANIQLFELAGHQVFVPVVAFNALYRWGGGSGQTSGSYLLGRATKTDKLGPLRADLGPRTFAGLGVKVLPSGVRN